MRTNTKVLTSAVIAFIISGCGGGGGGGSSTTAASPAPAAAPAQSGATGTGAGGVAAGGTVTLNGGSLKAEQKTASDLVTAVNGGVDILKQGSAGGNLPIGVVQTVGCSSFGGTGGTFTFDTDSIGDGIKTGSTFSYSFNNCNFAGFTYNGSVSETYNSYTNDSNYTVTYAWTNLTFGGGSASTGSETCTVKNNAETCNQYVNGYVVSNASVSTSGNTTTVNSGTLGGSTAYGNANCVYNGWVYNGSSATSGTVTLDYGNGNKVVITAGATSYTVKVTINGTTTTYTV